MITDESIVDKDTSSTLPEEPNTIIPKDEESLSPKSPDVPASPVTIEVNETLASNEESDVSFQDKVNATPSVEELTFQLGQMTQKAKTNWDNLVRQQAEYENVQKRMTRELDNARKYALEKFATELLAVKDSMEFGVEATTKQETDLQTIRDGMTLTLKMFTDAMTKFAIVEINPIEEKFDPQWHEAMAMQPMADVEDGVILHVHQKGYQLNERLLRPARVIVAKLTQHEEKPLKEQD